MRLAPRLLPPCCLPAARGPLCGCYAPATVFVFFFCSLNRHVGLHNIVSGGCPARGPPSAARVLCKNFGGAVDNTGASGRVLRAGAGRAQMPAHVCGAARREALRLCARASLLSAASMKRTAGGPHATSGCRLCASSVRSCVPRDCACGASDVLIMGGALAAPHPPHKFAKNFNGVSAPLWALAEHGFCPMLRLVQSTLAYSATPYLIPHTRMRLSHFYKIAAASVPE